MRKLMTVGLIVYVCCAAPLGADAAQIDGIDIVSYGTYTTGGAPGTVAGKAGSPEKVWKLMQKGDRIPAAIATSFGIEYVVKGAPSGEKINLTLRYLHPTIRNPKTGKRYDSQDVNITTLVGKVVHEGYTFDHEWELVTGAWIIQVFYDGRKLGEQYFTIYKP